MLKELFQLFGPTNPFEEIQKTFVGAYQAALDVLEMAHRAVWKSDSSQETARLIYDRDVMVNQRERDVRKMVVRHLSVQQGLDIIYCLRLMSLVKDVERIGDYGKNLFEITGLKTEEFADGELRDAVKTYGKESCAFVRRALEIFEAADEGRAESEVEHGRALMSQGEDLVRRVAQGDISANNAACFALMSRHYKRITGHATNVLTGLIMPIHKLDYYDEDLR